MHTPIAIMNLKAMEFTEAKAFPPFIFIKYSTFTWSEKLSYIKRCKGFL